jgi:hypothetical protein
LGTCQRSPCLKSLGGCRCAQPVTASCCDAASADGRHPTLVCKAFVSGHGLLTPTAATHTCCLQALVQFKDLECAREAQQLLDGSSIPDHLVPQHPGKITMKVSFSAHHELTIRSQSARSRYTGTWGLGKGPMC